jgi:hypothetical protein
MQVSTYSCWLLLVRAAPHTSGCVLHHSSSRSLLTAACCLHCDAAAATATGQGPPPGASSGAALAAHAPAELAAAGRRLMQTYKGLTFEQFNSTGACAA